MSHPFLHPFTQLYVVCSNPKWDSCETNCRWVFFFLLSTYIQLYFPSSPYVLSLNDPTGDWTLNLKSNLKLFNTVYIIVLKTMYKKLMYEDFCQIFVEHNNMFLNSREYFYVKYSTFMFVLCFCR